MRDTLPAAATLVHPRLPGSTYPFGGISGSGVAFTRNPANGINEFYGEFLVNAQGEDVVAGIRTPLPVEQMPKWNKQVHKQLLEIKDKGADSLILFGRPADVTLVIKQMSDLGIKLTTIGNASIVAQTTLNNLSSAEADGGYAIGGMIPQTSTDTKILDWTKRVQEKYKVPADNFTVSYYDTVYMVKSIIEKVGCDKAAIRDALAATKDWKGMLISYQADAQGDLAHTLGIYRNKGKTPELTGPIKESGY